EAYYLDEDADGTGFHDDGVRGHRSRRRPFGRLAGWDCGPFMVLFQTELRRSVAFLNRLLNHAAKIRSRTLASSGQPWRVVSEDALEPYRTELDIAGSRKIYLGDSHVWQWYRGTGVGPYPCMSALQALERVCDQYIKSGIAPELLGRL